jgi:hypothetical protein
MALIGAVPIVLPAAANDDSGAIRALIGATWDRSDSKVDTDPVVVSGQHAVASWTQGDRGGRALLKRDGKLWKVVLCSGDPLTHASSLIDAGVPKSDADIIAQHLAVEEARAPADRRAKFSLFEGTVMGDAPAHHLEHDHRPHP